MAAPVPVADPLSGQHATGPPGVDDGNRDGNVRSQPQAAAATDSETLLLDWAEQVIRYT